MISMLRNLIRYSYNPIRKTLRSCSIAQSSNGDGEADRVFFSFIEDNSGEKVIIDGLVGQTLLTAAKAYDMDLEAICDGQLSCSTCHVVCDPDTFAKLDPITEAESDLLETIPATNLTQTYASLLLFINP